MPQPPGPYEFLPKVPSFEVRSDDVTDAQTLSMPQVSGIFGAGLPADAKQLRNDAGLHGYLGSAPPAGHGPHRYMFAVHALNVDSLPITADVSPAICGFNMFGTTLARAIITPVYEQS